MRQYIGFDDEDTAEIQRVKDTLATQKERKYIDFENIHVYHWNFYVFPSLPSLHNNHQLLNYEM